MLELETYLKRQYLNIDYNILYFNFRYHTIPVTSNIINIVLHATEVYDTSENAPFEELRNYCGKILAELFNSKLNLGYDNTTFSN